MVHRMEGLTSAVGATFFGGRSLNDGAAFVLAPAVDQTYSERLKNWFYDNGTHPMAMVFGFHMLSNQKNVHGGIEMDSFRLPLVGENEPETSAINEIGSDILHKASTFAEEAGRKLAQAVQRTVGAGVRSEIVEDGVIRIKPKLESTPSVDDPFGRDVLAAYWRYVRLRLAQLAARVATDASDGPGALIMVSDERVHEFEEDVIREIRQLYSPVFDHHSTLPRTMPYAFTAKRMLNSALKKIRSFQPEAV